MNHGTRLVDLNQHISLPGSASNMNTCRAIRFRPACLASELREEIIIDRWRVP